MCFRHKAIMFFMCMSQNYIPASVSELSSAFRVARLKASIVSVLSLNNHLYHRIISCSCHDFRHDTIRKHILQHVSVCICIYIYTYIHTYITELYMSTHIKYNSSYMDALCSAALQSWLWVWSEWHWLCFRGPTCASKHRRARPRQKVQRREKKVSWSRSFLSLCRKPEEALRNISRSMDVDKHISDMYSSLAISASVGLRILQYSCVSQQCRMLLWLTRCT